jgi:hypothetical protein
VAAGQRQQQRFHDSCTWLAPKYHQPCQLCRLYTACAQTKTETRRLQVDYQDALDEASGDARQEARPKRQESRGGGGGGSVPYTQPANPHTMQKRN